MKRTALVAGLAAGALAVGLVAAAGPASAADSTKLAKQDVQFLRENDQTDHAEITLGRYIEANNPAHYLDHRFAARVVSDHTGVLTQATRLAHAHEITLPRLPNYQQRAAARRVKAAENTAWTYFAVEIAGHKTSIAQTKKEIADGQNKAVVAFAKHYLPIAENHLAMAERDLHRVAAKH